jgi:hypothetical protein
VATSPLTIEKRKPPVALVLVLAVMAVLGVALFYFFIDRTPAPKAQVTLTPEAKAYVKNLDLSGVEMKAAANMLNTTVVEITGKIGNKGPRALRLVEIICIFRDPYNREVYRERVPIVRDRGGSLKPGETRNFRLAFENLPPTWNQAMPGMVIAGIIFES